MADARIRGKGERRLFATRREAEGCSQLQRVKRQNEGGRAFHDSELTDCGWSVQDAIRFALDHLRRLRASVPLEQAISQLIETKQATGPDRTLLQRSTDAARKTPAGVPRYHHCADQHPGAGELPIGHEGGGPRPETLIGAICGHFGISPRGADGRWA
jgi:hypothetical protein